MRSTQWDQAPRQPAFTYERFLPQAVRPLVYGCVRVTIHNCPFRNTAHKFPQVCTITPHLLNNLLGASVSQSNSIHRHDPHCSFVVERPQPD